MLLTLVLVAHGLGLVTSVVALMSARTSQGAIAWVISLNTLPYLAVPLYWILGQPRFEGYVSARRGDVSRLREALDGLPEQVEPFRPSLPQTRGGITAVERLARMPVLSGNETRLLIDGEATFDSIFKGIARAREYVLVQFYTIRDDGMGRRLQEVLKAKVREGVPVHLLFDRIGSRSLTGRWVDELTEVGVKVHSFRSSRAMIRRRLRPRLQINFRNHRKIVVVDGREGWLGGLNVSDAYLGLDPKIGPWRDTHLHLRGPATLGLQLAFLEDWHWSAEEILELDWTPRPVDEADEPVLILPSGPADPVETAILMIHHAIHAAARRLWIATPYFVPDEGVLSALKLAALRGVDVRILVPATADVPLVHLAKLAVVEPLLTVGVRVLQYTAGFMHTKAYLVDDRAAGVGTVNLDNRSFRLNFEITALLMDRAAVARVEAMFEEDFRNAQPLEEAELAARPFWSRAASRAAHLLAPIL
jgi:cardiolipin synthase A/B